MNRLVMGLVVGLVICLPGAASAAFVDAYDIANWDTILSGDPPGGGFLWGEPSWLPGTSFDDEADSVSFVTGNQGCSAPPCSTNLVLRDGIPASGDISFKWSFAAAFDPFGYVLNGVFMQLTDDNFLCEDFPCVQTGEISLSVQAGNTFGFSLDCAACDQFPSFAEVWNFNFVEASDQAQVPEPATLTLVGAGLAAVALRFRKRIGRQIRP